MRGGARKGAGGKKPKLAPGLKRVKVSFTVRPDQAKWLKSLDGSQANHVIKALDLYREKVSL